MDWNNRVYFRWKWLCSFKFLSQLDKRKRLTGKQGRLFNEYLLKKKKIPWSGWLKSWQEDHSVISAIRRISPRQPPSFRLTGESEIERTYRCNNFVICRARYMSGACVDVNGGLLWNIGTLCLIHYIRRLLSSRCAQSSATGFSLSLSLGASINGKLRKPVRRACAVRPGQRGNRLLFKVSAQ